LDGTDAHMQGDGRDCPMRVDAAPEGSCCGIEIANASPSAVLNSTDVGAISLRAENHVSSWSPSFAQSSSTRWVKFTPSSKRAGGYYS
jgi:hypothetical protein